MKRPQTISLFSGCGGSDYALHSMGAKIIWANDIWEPACLTYKDNIPTPKIEIGDISDFHQFPTAELLVGCYPCQGYSQGGKRDWDVDINFLYRQFDRVLRAVQPKAFVVENVNGMAFGYSKQLLLTQLSRNSFAGSTPK